MFELSEFFRRSDASEDWLARYLVAEAHRGRRIADVLRDPAVLRHSSAATRARVLERHDVIAALAENAVAQVRAEIARGALSGGADPDQPASRPALAGAAEGLGRSGRSDLN